MSRIGGCPEVFMRNAVVASVLRARILERIELEVALGRVHFHGRESIKW